MAEDFLESIYKEARILCDLRQVAYWIKVKDTHHVVNTCNKLLPELGEICKKYVVIDKNNGLQLLQGIQRMTQIDEDLVLLEEIIERVVIPRLENLIKNYGAIELDNEEADYRFQTTESGFLTIKDLKHNKYYHSIIDPMFEAKKLAEYIYDPKMSSYAILGCGLGYLIYQLYILSNGSITIDVFEKDARMVEYAQKYGVLDWVPKEKLNICVCEDSYEFLCCADGEDKGYYIFAPELVREPDEMRDVLQEVNIKYNTHKRFEKNRSINFWRNIKSDSKLVTDFDTTNLSKDYIVIAAGPSLDDSMEFLRNNQGKKTLVAVGTVYKKLIQNNIIPDMVVVLDPQERTCKQIEGLENEKIPLLIGMTAYWGFAASYRGEKYLIPMIDIVDIVEASNYAKEQEWEFWSCGGTVTALAIDVALKFGAKQIYLVGVDMAFPDGVTHATGTMDRTTKDINKLMPIEGVGNKTVYADRVFICYREWIENRIAQTPQVVYYNMSCIGAKIAGTKECVVEE